VPIEKKPTNPLAKDFRPPQSNPHRVKNGDSWGIVARRHEMTAWDLIRFNFNTSDAAEVNWYLNHNVGCTEQTRNGRNYIFSASANPGVIYVPMKVIHSPPITIEGQRPKEPETIAFWFNAVQGSVSLWKFLSYRKLVGDLCMRINKSPSDWYAWRLSASLGKVSVPIKGSPPISPYGARNGTSTFKPVRRKYSPTAQLPWFEDAG